MRDPADQLLPLVEKLYDAAGGETGWEGFLEPFATTLRAVIPGVFVHDRPAEAATLAVTVGMDPTWGEAYDSYYIRHDLRRRKIWTLPHGSIFVGNALLPDEELLRSEFYNDFLRPQGFFHILGAVPVKTDDTVAVLRVIRPRSSPAFGRDELELVRRLVPHLARAVALAQQLALAEARRDELVEALDWFPTAVLLLDRRCRIVAANRSAEDLLAAGDGLRTDRDGLRAATPGDTLALRQMLAAAVEPTAQGSAHGDGTLSIARPSPRRPLNLLVAPLRAPIVQNARTRAQVAVFVTDPDRVAIAPVERLQHYLGVTRAEADLVMWLVQGHRLEEAADELGITVNTARTQLKRALAKTGTGRQAELVRLALSTPATLGVQTYEQERARASTAASRPRRRMA